MQIITIEITKDGEIKSNATGFKGKSCSEITNKLLVTLGTGQEKKKSEYFEKEKKNKVGVNN